MFKIKQGKPLALSLCENWKFSGRGGMEEILFDTLKYKEEYKEAEYKEAEVFWVANDRQNTSSSSVRSSNTFNKKVNKHSITSAKWVQSIIGNKLPSLY